MRWALTIAQLLGGGPPHETIALTRPELRGMREHPPAGGWRCRRCDAPATHVVTWPGAHAGWCCDDHRP